MDGSEGFDKGESAYFLPVWKRVINRYKRVIHAANFKRFRKSLLKVSKQGTDLIFVKVGANDGISGDPCSDILVTSPAWRGLLIEPVPYLFDRLRGNFKDTTRFLFEQCAVGRKGCSPFFYLDPSASKAMAIPDWSEQIGSFNRQHIVAHLGVKVEPFIRQMDLNVVPLSEILAKHGITKCDLLHIDTEGHDYQVLCTLDFTVIKPKMIFIEHKHLSTSEGARLLHFLKKESYRIFDCGQDYFAVI